MNSQILSISGYTQKYLLSQLTKSLSRGDYQSASLWSVEMHISGWIVKWWIGIVSYCANYIHISNPKISKFLWKMSMDYPVLRGMPGNPNSNETRQVIALVVGVCVFSPKDNPHNIPKPLNVAESDRSELFHSIDKIQVIKEVQHVSMEKDSIIMKKLLSNLAKNIRESNYCGCFRILSICLFLEKHKSYKNTITCATRNWKGLQQKHWNSWIFLLWDLLFYLGKKKNIEDIIGSWRALYIMNCDKSKFNSLLSYVVNSISLLTNDIKTDLPCVHNENMINKGCQKIDYIYGTVLKNYAANRAVYNFN